MVDIGFIESLNIPQLNEPSFLSLHHESCEETLPFSMASEAIPLICPEKPKMLGIVIEKTKIDIQRMLYMIYYTLLYTNLELKYDLNFQLFIIHFGWIKTMATQVSYIGGNYIVYAIHKEFFQHMSYDEFLLMVRTIKFKDCVFSEYYKAFCSLVDRNNYIDWASLETKGCADYESQNAKISDELENMSQLVKIFNQYIQKNS
jgi:hypothetical protein